MAVCDEGREVGVARRRGVVDGVFVGWGGGGEEGREGEEIAGGGGAIGD